MAGVGKSRGEQGGVVRGEVEVYNRARSDDPTRLCLTEPHWSRYLPSRQVWLNIGLFVSPIVRMGQQEIHTPAIPTRVITSGICIYLCEDYMITRGPTYLDNHCSLLLHRTHKNVISFFRSFILTFHQNKFFKLSTI